MIHLDLEEICRKTTKLCSMPPLPVMGAILPDISAFICPPALFPAHTGHRIYLSTSGSTLRTFPGLADLWPVSESDRFLKNTLGQSLWWSVFWERNWLWILLGRNRFFWTGDSVFIQICSNKKSGRFVLKKDTNIFFLNGSDQNPGPGSATLLAFNASV